MKCYVCKIFFATTILLALSLDAMEEKLKKDLCEAIDAYDVTAVREVLNGLPDGYAESINLVHYAKKITERKLKKIKSSKLSRSQYIFAGFKTIFSGAVSVFSLYLLYLLLKSGLKSGWDWGSGLLSSLSLYFCVQNSIFAVQNANNIITGLKCNKEQEAKVEEILQLVQGGAL